LYNINSYNEIQFQKKFELTKLYQSLASDFSHITWDSHCDIYKMFTPRQFLGDTSKNICSAVPFYYLEYLLESSPTQIHDLGCGWNMFKKYIPNIIGVGEEDPAASNYYGDEPGRVDQDYIDAHQNYFESVFSINALHFIPLESMRQRVIDFISMIAPGGRGFITLNLLRMIDRSSDDFLINTFGTLRPTNQQFDTYVRNSLTNLPCKCLVFDVDVLESLNDVMEGNIRLVLEK
jgi:hypothetical protein